MKQLYPDDQAAPPVDTNFVQLSPFRPSESSSPPLTPSVAIPPPDSNSPIKIAATVSPDPNPIESALGDYLSQLDPDYGIVSEKGINKP